MALAGTPIWDKCEEKERAKSTCKECECAFKGKMCSSGEQCGLQVSFPIVTKKMVLVTTKEEK